MGWTFSPSWRTKEAVVAELLGDGYHKTIAHRLVGHSLWCVKEGPKDGRYIALFLLQSSRHGWGYKDMDESCHPYYYNCPLSFLALRTCKTGKYAAEWLAKVYEFHGVSPGQGALALEVPA